MNASFNQSSFQLRLIYGSVAVGWLLILKRERQRQRKHPGDSALDKRQRKRKRN